MPSIAPAFAGCVGFVFWVLNHRLGDSATSWLARTPNVTVLFCNPKPANGMPAKLVYHVWQSNVVQYSLRAPKYVGVVPRALPDRRVVPHSTGLSPNIAYSNKAVPKDQKGTTRDGRTTAGLGVCGWVGTDDLISTRAKPSQPPSSLSSHPPRRSPAQPSREA